MRYVGRPAVGAPQAILTGIPSGTTHNGGGLWFSGHAEPVRHHRRHPQQRARPGPEQSLAGKILRMTPTGDAQAGNPFGNRVWSYGHRNPEGITSAPTAGSGPAELGENTWDELNRILPGRNYGWPRVEGKDGAGGYRDPLAQWHHRRLLAERRRDARRPGLGRRAARRVPLVGATLRPRPAPQGAATSTAPSAGSGTVKRAPDRSLWITTSNGGGRDKVVRVTVG